MASQTFSISAIAAALGGAACRFDIDVLAECGSTNAELLARAERGAPSGTVVAAERQTAGRGRMGREWIAVPGDSLTFSLLWRFPAGTNPSGLSLAVGVAVARALQKVGAGDTVLKWPNDVLKDGGKVGGILIELQSATAAIIGIGLNLRLPVAMPDAVRATAAALDLPVDPNALLATVLAELLAVLDAFAAGGFAVLRDEWLARHAWTGQPVRVIVPHAAAIEGRCAGIDADGALLLETAAGMQRILSGDVSLRLMESA
ncbi:MAG: biotin--[acetyl-CoA-carboxylase] ligase [Sulfurisoma sp.]|nr:biotin--[acetyl-CoA-carboxylase] ligase [Sulfurisoma sp.]